MTNDTYKHRGLRKKLVEELRTKGIQDERVLAAINKVPRHLFLDSSFLEYAYLDKAFPIGSGQTISQPYTVAVQSTILNIQEGDKVLEIGTGSGYQACILEELGAKVFSIERQKKLYLKTKSLLSDLGYFIKFFYGDGYKGLPAYAPFDKIIITAGAPNIPEVLIDQLKCGGVLVAPLGSTEKQTMISIAKSQNGKCTRKEHGTFRFVPLLERRAKD